MLPYHGKLINNEKDTDTSNSLEETRGHFAELKKKKAHFKSLFTLCFHLHNILRT